MRWIIKIMIIVALTGCARLRLEPYVPAPECPAPDSINVPLCQMKKTCSMCMKESLFFYLRSHDVQVVRVGEDIRLIIPSDNLFRSYSANFIRDYLPVLSATSTLISCYDQVGLKVAAYTDCGGPAIQNTALSQRQAEKVQKFFGRRGVDTRYMYAKGYGPLYPIANDTDYYSRARNRRIEITFRRLN